MSVPAMISNDPNASRLPLSCRSAVDDWLSSLSARTRLAYEADLRSFSGFLNVDDSPSAIIALVQGGQADANLLALKYRTSLVESQLAPATVNRRLAALRSAVGLLRTAGVVQWELEVKSVKAVKYRDTRGPSVAVVKALLQAAGSCGKRGLRDRALILLLFGMALRRGEVVSLDIDHLDLEGKRLFVMGKARGGEREPVTVPGSTLRALKSYLNARDNPKSGPLFLSLDRACEDKGRLTGEGVRHILLSLAGKAGLEPIRPHGLRHAAITSALDAGRDLREVLRFSRHKDPRTILQYDDSRRDHAGEVSAVVSQLVSSDEGDGAFGQE